MHAGEELGPYRIAGKLGEGGMGAVYRAHDTRLGRDVALKLLPDTFLHDPERTARFTREAQMLASLNHPNVATIYGLEPVGGGHVIVMELVEGETLEARLCAAPSRSRTHSAWASRSPRRSMQHTNAALSTAT